jgi:hypothetical protein
MKTISWGIFTFTILYGFIPMRLENHTLVMHLSEIYHTPAVGKSYPVIHLCEIYHTAELENHTLAVGKSYLSHALK